MARAEPPSASVIPATLTRTAIARFHGRATLDRTLAGPGNLLFVPRIASSFDLTDQQTLVLGAFRRLRPERHRRAQTDADLRHGPVLEMEISAMRRRASRLFRGKRKDSTSASEPGRIRPPSVVLPTETLRIGASIRRCFGDSSSAGSPVYGENTSNGNQGAFDSNDVFRGERTRMSPDLTFYPSEFSKDSPAIQLRPRPALRRRAFGMGAGRIPPRSARGAQILKPFVTENKLNDATMKRILMIILLLAVLLPAAHAKLDVVATTPDFGSVAREIGGDECGRAHAGKANRRPAFRGRETELHCEAESRRCAGRRRSGP